MNNAIAKINGGKMRTIRNLDLYGKTAIIRCDFNVPIKDGMITDDNRIKESLPTIKYVVNKGAKVLLMSHLGRIESEADKKDKSLRIVAEHLKELLRQEVHFLGGTRGVEGQLKALKNGDVAMLENTRFEDFPKPLESKNDPELAKYWASLGDVFINEAFGTLHREHASNVGIASLLPSAIGFLIEKEINQLEKFKNPLHPFVFILGGAKVSDKIFLIERFVEKADFILVGGGIANTFNKARGYNMGKSLVDEASLEFCRKILSQTDKIIMPVDARVADEISETAKITTKKISEIAETDICLDIGPDTVSLFQGHLRGARSVVWNGTVGYAELKHFLYGTREIAEILNRLDAISLVAGGDTVAAVKRMNLASGFSHVSTGGGTVIEMLEGKELPGLRAIK